MSADPHRPDFAARQGKVTEQKYQPGRPNRRRFRVAGTVGQCGPSSYVCGDVTSQIRFI